MFQNKTLLYIGKFLGAFAILFYGTEAVIGLSAPGDNYSPFVAGYLNFIDPFRRFLLEATRFTVSVFGFETAYKDQYTLAFLGGRGIRMVYSCLGYGVISFWIAFVFANGGSFKKKGAWMLAGAGALIAINIARLSLLLVATNKAWSMPFGWDHHTWFNIIAYALIFLGMWAYDRGGSRGAKNRSRKAEKKNIGMSLPKKEKVEMQAF